MNDAPLAWSRAELGACLLAAGRAQVLDAARRLGEGLHVTPITPPESGLALLQWRDAVMHQPFFLGEVPMARAAVALRNARGERAEGGAVLMADDAELAQAVAVLDAVWAQRWPGAELVEALARQGAAARAATRRERQALLARTRVDFSLMSQADGDDAAQDAA